MGVEYLRETPGEIRLEKVNIGVIGCGKMVLDLVRRSVKMERANVVAVYDPLDEAKSAAAGEFSAEPSRSIEELAHRPSVEAVLVGSPPGFHHGNVLAAAAVGKHIYCEKPLAISVAQCDEMITACEKSGSKLFVGQVLRLFPLFWKSHELIEEGVIGEPRAVSVTRTGYAPQFGSGWRAKRSEAGGLLLEINAHELDYLRFLLGQPESVYAKMDNLYGQTDYEDQSFLIITFKSGATGALHSSLSSPVGEFRVHIQGTLGNMIHGGFGGALRCRRRGDPDEKEISLKPEDLNLPDPYNRELTSFYDWVTENKTPLFTGHDGRAAVAMAEAAYESIKTGAPAKVK